MNSLILNIFCIHSSLMGIHLRIRMLNTPPKYKAITVQESVITLYGIEKSGVGNRTSSELVYIIVELNFKILDPISNP